MAHSATKQLLPFGEHNTDRSDTILFIHGALSSRAEWDLVVPHLADYHLLLPDLPAHGQARDIQPFSKSAAATFIADTIRSHAHGGKAHIVGLSLGASVAVELIVIHPEVINDVVLSGFKFYPHNAFTSFVAPHALWLDQALPKMVPGSLVRWLTDAEAPQLSNSEPATLDECRAITGTLMQADSDGKWPSPWSARTLIISAGKSGLLPTADHPQAAIRIRDIAREQNPETVAYTHPLMRHAWNRQDPALFARTARAWIERDKLPDGFVEL